jgi:hypothetical protein
MAKVESIATASRARLTALRSPSMFVRTLSLYFRSAGSEAVVACANDGVALIERNDSPALPRKARASLSAASIRPRGPSPGSRKEASSMPESARTRRTETM